MYKERSTTLSFVALLQTSGKLWDELTVARVPYPKRICPAGYSYDKQSKCLPCAPGTYSKNGKECQVCEKKTYEEDDGSDHCEFCPSTRDVISTLRLLLQIVCVVHGDCLFFTIIIIKLYSGRLAHRKNVLVCFRGSHPALQRCCLQR